MRISVFDDNETMTITITVSAKQVQHQSPESIAKNVGESVRRYLKTWRWALCHDERRHHADHS